MVSNNPFIGKWQFDYWSESNETTILEIHTDGFASTIHGTRYKWERLCNNGIHIYIEGYVDYVGFLRNSQITGHAISDYSMNEWTWKAIPWKGPIINPIAKNDIENKKWIVLNKIDELDNFQATFFCDGTLTTLSGKSEVWKIEDGKLIFTYASRFINYIAENIDNAIKGHAKNKIGDEWDFTLEFIEEIKKKSTLTAYPQPITSIGVNPPKYKDDKDAILHYLKHNNVEYFYHFTDVRNIPKIKEYGGLFSWDYIRKNGLDVPVQGGDELSKKLDRMYSLEDYVRVSFCTDHPMAYTCKMYRNMDLVLLKIKIDVATLNETRFSDINAAKKGHKEGSTFADLQRINIAATRMHYLRKEDIDFSFHQAEVMVKTHIPLEYIVNIDNPDKI